MIKTAVIGGSSYIGSHLLKKYRQFFPDCIGTKFSHGDKNLHFFDLQHPNLASLNLKKTNHHAAVICSAKPTIAWCESNRKESYTINVKSTLEVVKQLEKLSIKTIFLSTDHVFNGETGNYTDLSETAPSTEYGRQKAEVEKEIPNLTSNYIIFRLSKIYGTAWRDDTLIDNLAHSLLQNKKVLTATDQYINPTHIDDVVSMIIYCQNQNVNGLINLCNERVYSRHQIAQKLATVLNTPLSLIQAVKLNEIPGMEKRPLNTSLVPSTLLKHLQPFSWSIDEAIKCVAKNWLCLS